MESAGRPSDRPDEFLSVRRVEERVGLSKSSIHRRIKAGTFPAPVVVDSNVVRWSSLEISEWQRKQIARRDEGTQARPQAPRRRGRIVAAATA